MKIRALSLVLTAFVMSAPALAGDNDPGSTHASFVEAFNARDWTTVKSMLAEDAVFQRATGSEAHVGPDAIVDRWSSTIAGEWNVMFTKLDPAASFTGKDGRVVLRGDFAVTAGADSSACYAGFFMATYKPNNDDWSLQVLNWQDVEADMSNC